MAIVHACTLCTIILVIETCIHCNMGGLGINTGVLGGGGVHMYTCKHSPIYTYTIT